MKKKITFWEGFKIRIIIVVTINLLFLASNIYYSMYSQYHNLMINHLGDNAKVIHEYVEEFLDKKSFFNLNEEEDEQTALYKDTLYEMDKIRRLANIKYLYTAKKNSNNEYIYSRWT